MRNPPDPLPPEAILSTWMNEHYAFIHRLALSILEDGDDAEDAAQQTFINAGLHLGEFAGRSSPRTWLAAIAVNQCRAELRRRRARLALQNTLGALQRLVGGQVSGEGQALAGEQSNRLAAEIRKLDEKHRLPLLMRYVLEMPIAEIAQILGIREGTAHSRLHHARRQLAGRLGGFNEDFQEAAP